MFASVVIEAPKGTEARYRGLRMTADEYFALEDDGFLYELVDGVVCMSPSPTPEHQDAATQISAQIATFLNDHLVGKVFVELDVNLGQGPTGGDIVYRPDVVFIRAEKVARNRKRIDEPPDLAVEIVSDTSRRYDNETKKGDYERAGVMEYWVIDPNRGTMSFYRLRDGRYELVQPKGDAFASEAIPGFSLDLSRVRRTFPELE